ncbi:MAG: hypothetical protein IJG13_15545, partial [Kiritimatiellae bacterium]|nr:hypothetical protein [Kiritimatiellia bacterium]
PPFMSFMRLRYNYIIIDDAMQGGMLILLKIPIAQHTERYRQSGKVGLYHFRRALWGRVERRRNAPM